MNLSTAPGEDQQFYFVFCLWRQRLCDFTSIKIDFFLQIYPPPCSDVRIPSYHWIAHLDLWAQPEWWSVTFGKTEGRRKVGLSQCAWGRCWPAVASPAPFHTSLSLPHLSSQSPHVYLSADSRGHGISPSSSALVPFHRWGTWNACDLGTGFKCVHETSALNTQPM